MIINGIKYKLKFTNRSLINVEKELGVGILEVVKDDKLMSKLNTMAVFIWAGVGSDNVTLDDVIDSIDFSDYADVLEEITIAFNEAFNTGQKKKK